jgi:hypothetical protein
VNDDDNNDYSWADGPGKFAAGRFNRATAYVYDLSPDAQIGSVDELGWYGLVYLNIELANRVVELGWKPDTDADPESKPDSVILYEDTQGFVTATFYDSEDAADTDWETIEEQYENFYKSDAANYLDGW